MFGLPFELAIVVTGSLMICYVLFGGMIATTWVQIIKAVLLLGGATLLVIMTLEQIRFQLCRSLQSGVEQLHYGNKFLEPGGLVTSPSMPSLLALPSCSELQVFRISL